VAFATTDDGVQLYYEEHGAGTPLLFIHEFAGDHRSWDAQVRHFSRRYRCIVYGARGYPPSAVPSDPEVYGQLRAVEDAVAVLDAAGAGTAHVVGNGAHPDKEPKFRAESEAIAVAFETEGSASVAEWYGVGPARVQYQGKDPRGHAEHVQVLAEHDALGAALTMRGVQKSRPSLYGLREELSGLDVPVLIVAGDEDDGVLETNLMLKRTLPRCGLAVLPRSGHVTNLEEPALYNQLVQQFLGQVEHGRWGPRDPRSLSSSTTGAK